MTLALKQAIPLALALVGCLAGCTREPEKGQKGTASQRLAASAKVSDACRQGPRCQGPKRALICSQGVEEPIECRGPLGCVQEGVSVSCDNTLARTGDACDEEHDFACALDRKAALECQSGVFRVIDAYSGIQGCSLKGDEISCDKSVPPACDDIEDIACCLSFARRPRAN